MKVAIIGANGQLGSDLVEIFGERAVPLTHNDLDVTNYDSLKILKKIDPNVIINTAAYVRVDDAEKEPKKAFNVNAIGALYVAKIANELDAINVYISTDYVFDGRKGAPYTEEDMPNPINVYGASKYMGEIFTRNYSKKYYVVRVASLYGKKGARGKGGNFVNWIIEKAKGGEEIKVVDDIIMSPTYTRDVAKTLKKLLEIKPEYGIYHMANEGYCSWYEFAKSILDIIGYRISLKSIKSVELNRLAKRPIFSAIKNKNIKRIGLRMPKWEEAIRKYLEDIQLIR
ncbi:dTDP-4-dehydrorhamnose reductase [Aciduliprofundum boonei T469]|nr:dTDP-4-dehydrorhamnose reductase [Aciduliprofundum boonei T469]